MPQKRERCHNCVFWKGPGIGVDHAHCSDRRSPHQTTSKNGKRKYDTCLYFTNQVYRLALSDGRNMREK